MNESANKKAKQKLYYSNNVNIELKEHNINTQKNESQGILCNVNQSRPTSHLINKPVLPHVKAKFPKLQNVIYFDHLQLHF